MPELACSGSAWCFRFPPRAKCRERRRSSRPRGARSLRERRPSWAPWPTPCQKRERPRPPNAFGLSFPGPHCPMDRPASCRCPRLSSPPSRPRLRRPGLQEIHGRAAAAFFDLAKKAAGADSGQYALASVCLRAVLDREPDHKEARRLLGYVPHGKGWATPFAVRRLQENNVNHPTFGWVPADWVPHLDRGELPAPTGKGQRKTRWLPVAEADRLRAAMEPAVEIRDRALRDPDQRHARRSDHLRPPPRGLSRPIHDHDGRCPGRKPAARSGASKTRSSRPSAQPVAKLHQVYYFGSKAEFVEHWPPARGPRLR